MRALLYCVLLLAAVEIALRVTERRSIPAAGLLPGEPTLCLALGSSRTLRGLVPAVMERELADTGHPGTWAADVTRLAITMAGEYQLYREEVRPRLTPGTSHGILAIEVRGGGLNDSYLTDEEARLVATLEPAEAAGDAGLGRDVWGLLSRGHLEDAAGVALGALRLAHLADRRHLQDPEGVSPDASWLEGRKGFSPFQQPRPADLRRAFWREQYQERLLKDYTLGGVQTQLLRRLVREVRADGLEPALYVMPVTPIHRGFFAPGDYERFLALVAQVSREEHVPFFDLDTGNTFTLDQFYDTHHLDEEAARRFSKTFAREVFGSLLESR